MASMASMQKMLQMYQPAGDPRTIDQYNNAGDWAQNKGYGTLKTISDLLSKFGDMQNKDKAQQQDQLTRNALIQYGQKIGALQPDVPNKIDTSGSEIPFKGPDSGVGPPQVGLSTDQMNSASMSPQEESQLPQYDKMTTPNVMSLVKLGMPQQVKHAGTGNPALDMIKEASDILYRNKDTEYTDPERFAGYLADLDAARKGYFGSNPTPKDPNDQSKKYFKK